MPPHKPRGQPELRTHRPYLVLEERPQRLHELKLQIIGQSADVVMTFDIAGALPPAGFNNVGIEGALHQKFNFASLADHLAGCCFESPDELSADDLALLLRISNPGERREESRGGIDDLEVDPSRGHVVALDLLALTFATQTR